MAYADLTTEQKSVLDEWLNQLRATMGELARVNNHLEVADDAYNGQTSAILNELQGSDLVPNAGGLAGAQSLTKDEVVTMVSYAQGILTNYNTSGHRQNFGKAAGSANLIG